MLESFIKSLTNPLKLTVNHILQSQLFELTVADNASVAQKATKVNQLLQPKKPFHRHTMDLSRGAKLTTMVRNSLENANQQRDSQLNKSLPIIQTCKKKSAEFPKIFGKPDSEEYVAIDSEYKFDKKKLSAHQKEQLNKRRDDIPSLYVDLSQETQSQSLSEDTSKLEISNNNSTIDAEILINVKNNEKVNQNDKQKANHNTDSKEINNDLKNIPTKNLEVERCSSRNILEKVPSKEQSNVAEEDDTNDRSEKISSTAQGIKEVEELQEETQGKIEL